MGRPTDVLSVPLREFIERQKMFFVATAPLAAAGHINLSPKGLDTFWVLDERTVVYADLCGSGIETVAHLKENGRIVLMFCAFEGSPKIVRLHGRGEVIEPGDPGFDELRRRLPPPPGLRSFIRMHCDRIEDSCGFGVPRFEFKGQRDQLIEWAERQGPDRLVEYQRAKNAQSIDGLPGIGVP